MARIRYFLIVIIFNASADITPSSSQEIVETEKSLVKNNENTTLHGANFIPLNVNQETIYQTGLMGDNVAEIYNFLDGDSFGIGPMHEFVHGWQAILKAMRGKNNAEVRKRAGMQRMALAGLNGVSLISHIGVTQVMINGTRTFCFGGVVRPVIRPNIVCNGAMYQEGAINCKLPYLRYMTSEGYKVCVGKLAKIRHDWHKEVNDRSINNKTSPTQSLIFQPLRPITSTTHRTTTYRTTIPRGSGNYGYGFSTTTEHVTDTDVTDTDVPLSSPQRPPLLGSHLKPIFATQETVPNYTDEDEYAKCHNGLSYPKFHYDYICERSEVRIRRLNFTDPNERFNLKNPVVRRVEYYRSENDILKQCADWYGCDFRVSEEEPHDMSRNICDHQDNETAFVGFGGRYWLSIYYAKLSSWARYFQGFGPYPRNSNKSAKSAKGNIWDLLMKVNIGPDMNLHYNLNGIYNKYQAGPFSPDIMNNDRQVQPSSLSHDWKQNNDAALKSFQHYLDTDPFSISQNGPRS